MDAALGASYPPPPSRPGFSLGEAAADEDAAQGVLLAARRHRGADVQVAEGVKAGGAGQWDFLGDVSKVRTLGGDQQDPAPQKEGSIRIGREKNNLCPLFTDPSPHGRTITRKPSSVWEVGITLLENPRVTDKIKVEIRQHYEPGGSGNTTQQNSRKASEAMLVGIA